MLDLVTLSDPAANRGHVVFAKPHRSFSNSLSFVVISSVIFIARNPSTMHSFADTP
jgi:hypothetical protein